MEEILHQLIGSLSHYLQGFIHPRWCRISSINSISCIFGWNMFFEIRSLSKSVDIWRNCILPQLSICEDFSTLSTHITWKLQHKTKAGWWFSNIFYFHPYLGKWSILSKNFSNGLKPPTRKRVPPKKQMAASFKSRNLFGRHFGSTSPCRWILIWLYI